jgi:hypothetical protein
MQTVLLIIDPQSTELAIICQALYEQGVQNMVMLHHA